MSYILEALKKSEQERNAEKVPNLETHHQLASAPSQSHSQIKLLVLALVIINLAVVGYFLIQNNQEQNNLGQSNQEQPIETQLSELPVEQSQTAQQPAQSTTKQVTTQPEMQVTQRDNQTSNSINQTQPITEVNKSAQSTVTSTQAPPVTQPTQRSVTRTRTQPPALSKESVPDITELSMALQEQIPAIEFTTHIFVKEGGSFVIINGKSLGDGMAISRGLQLVKIVSDGVILEFRGQRFFLGALSNW